MNELIAPKKIMTCLGRKLDVIQYVGHPKGCIPSINPELMALELKTIAGSRFFGFERVFIGSDLNMHCQGYNENFEELKTWRKVK